jgi:hypothetical protein
MFDYNNLSSYHAYDINKRNNLKKKDHIVFERPNKNTDIFE